MTKKFSEWLLIFLLLIVVILIITLGFSVFSEEKQPEKISNTTTNNLYLLYDNCVDKEDFVNAERVLSTIYLIDSSDKYNAYTIGFFNLHYIYNPRRAVQFLETYHAFYDSSLDAQFETPFYYLNLSNAYRKLYEETFDTTHLKSAYYYAYKPLNFMDQVPSREDSSIQILTIARVLYIVSYYNLYSDTSSNDSLLKARTLLLNFLAVPFDRSIISIKYYEKYFDFFSLLCKIEYDLGHLQNHEYHNSQKAIMYYKNAILMSQKLNIVNDKLNHKYKTFPDTSSSYYRIAVRYVNQVSNKKH